VVWVLGSAARQPKTMTLIAGGLAQPSHPLRFVLVALAGCINPLQRAVIDYLQEENRCALQKLDPSESPTKFCASCQKPDVNSEHPNVELGRCQPGRKVVTSLQLSYTRT
jgi:hypothetical protein